MFNLDIKGAKSLNRKLNRMGQNEGRKVVRPALRSALAPVTQTAKANAPRDTGRMANSIKAFVKNSRRNGLVGGVRTGTRKQLGIPADAEYYYPVAVELGSRGRAPQSFLRSALKSRRNEALQILGREIHQALKKI